MFYKPGDGKIAVCEKHWQSDGAEAASVCEAGLGILLSSGLLTSGGDGVTRMDWLKGKDVEYRIYGVWGRCLSAWWDRQSEEPRGISLRIVAYC